MDSTPVELSRTKDGAFVATNPRGAQVRVGPLSAEGAFTPGELLLVAAAGCAGITSERLIVRRIGEEAPFHVHADRTKEDADAHEFSSVDIRLEVDLSGLEEPQREALQRAVHQAVERFCTVSRTLEREVPVTLTVGG